MRTANPSGLDVLWGMGVEEEETLRPATERDRALFAELWMEFLVENATKGATYAPTQRTLGFFLETFDRVLSGEWGGVALIDPEGAALLWPCLPVPFDYNFPGADGPVGSGLVAHGFGTYLRPALRGSGYGFHIQGVALDALRQQGIKFFMGGVPPGNEASQGLSVKHGTTRLDTAVLLPLGDGDGE